MPARGGAAASALRSLDYLICQPIHAALLHGAGVAGLFPAPERFAIHKLMVGSRRMADRHAVAKRAQDRLQDRSIIEAILANRQQGDLAAAFMEAWDRGPHSRAAIGLSLATYDEGFQSSLRTQLAQGIPSLASIPRCTIRATVTASKSAAAGARGVPNKAAKPDAEQIMRPLWMQYGRAAR